MKKMKKKSCILLLFWLVTSFVPLKSQTLTWDGIATGITPTTITIAGDAAKLRFTFVANGGDILNANIEVALPAGYTGTAIAAGSGMAGGITYTTSGLNTATVTVTIAGGKLAAGKAVDLILDVKAGCSALLNGNASIKVKSGSSVLSTGTRMVAMVGAYPALRVQSSTPNQTGTIGQIFNFDLELDVANDMKANSFKLTLGKTASTTLTDFKLDGIAVTPTTNDETTVEFTFNNINLESTVRHLTFKASDTYAGTKNIATKLQYLNGSGGSNCGSPVTGPVFTFGAPAVAGTASIDTVRSKINWVNDATPTAVNLNNVTQVPMDGITIAYFRVTYKNKGSAPTKQIKQSLQAYRSAIYNYANIVEDLSKIKYSVDGGTTIKTAPLGSVVFSDRNTALSNGYRKLKAAYANTPRKAEITINEALQPGQELMVFWPIVQGDVYDNTGFTPTLFAEAYPWASIQWNYYNITATDQNGASVAVPQNTYGAGAINNPLFSSTPPSLSFRETGPLSQQQVKILTEFGTVSGTTQYTELYIQLPSWLTLDGTPATAITTTGMAGTPQDLGSGKYVVRVNTGGKRYVTINYKVNGTPCSGANQTGEIYYWLDYILGGGAAAKRPPMKEIAQIRQKVTLLCESAGIEMTNFEPFRLSKGLKDSDQNRVPDSNTPALDSEILHDTYLYDDNGKLIIEGTVKASFQHLYVLLSSPTLNLTAQQMQAATISIGGSVSVPVSAYVKTSDNKKHYLRHDYSFTSGTTIKIEIPFTARTNNVSATVKAELYMTDASTITDPFNPSSSVRKGKDELYIPLMMYSSGFATDRSNDVFTDNNPRTDFNLAYMDSYHGNNFTYPFFEKEYRVVGKLKYYDITLPSGYIIPSGSPLTMTFNTGYTSTTDVKAQSPNHVKTISTAPVVTPNANGSITYRFNLTGVYQNAYDGDGTYGSMPTGATGKWIYPDERYFYNFSTTVQATPAAVASGIITCKSTFTSYASNHLRDTSSTRNFNVAYTGDKATLAPSTNSVTAYSKRITLPVLGVSNAGTSAKPMWLYIKEGDGSFTINNVSAKPLPGGTAISGTGNGKWINLGTRGANSTTDYELSFDVSAIPCSGSKQVEIYLFTNFATSFSPNTSAEPTTTNLSNHMGDSKKLSFTASTAAIAGSISVNDNSIKYQLPYTLTAELSASGGQGDVYEGQMTITVPKGQKYIAGSAQYIYNGTTTTVPGGVETAINSALSGSLGSDRPYTFKISDFISGDNLSGVGSGAPANKQTIRLKMNFQSECETDLLNTLYMATIAGKTVCGNPATGNGNKVADVKMNYTSNIFFSVTPQMQTGINAFNEIHRKDTLQINLEKTFGSGNLTANDYVELIMHENVNIKSGGNVVVSSTNTAVNGVSVAVNSNTTALGKRNMKIALPWNELNGQGNGGQYVQFIYKIPLEYIVSDTVSPVNKIEVNVQNEVKLHSSCPPQMFPVGSDELGFGLVVGNTNPDTVYLGDMLPLHIKSAGFTGTWYDVPTGGLPVSTANPYNFTPTDTALLGDTTFYFSAEFGSNNYGRLPYNVKVYIHPSFIKNLDTMKIACKEKETLSVQAFGMDLKYQWYYNLTTPVTGATDTFYMASLPGFYHVVATDSVGESVSSDTLNLYINEVPVFTKNLPNKVTECNRWRYMLKAETTGHHLIYQWYRDGIEIPGANSDTYYAIADDSSAYFRVSVKTLCGDSIMSNQCYVYFCDQMDSIYINREIKLIAPNTVDTDPGVGIHRIKSQQDFNFTIKVHEGFTLDHISIATDDPIWTDQGGIVKEKVSENEMKVSIRTVTKPLTVTVSGIVPVSNQDIEVDPSKIWASDGKIYVRSTEENTVYIFTTRGHLYKQEKVKEGISSFYVEPGIYFVKLNSGYTGKVFVK